MFPQSVNEKYILLYFPLFSRRLRSDQRYELPIGVLVPLIKESDAEQLIGDAEPAAVPGDFDGISCDGPETALKRVFSGRLIRRSGRLWSKQAKNRCRQDLLKEELLTSVF